MTNAEKYKTAEERREAYRRDCAHRAEQGDFTFSPFEWLDLEYKKELLPCPFCGGEAVVDKEIPFLTPTFRVKCSVCGIGTDIHSFKQPSIDAWNRRVK